MAEIKRHGLISRAADKIKNRLIAGILVVAPLWMTFAALRFFFRRLDSFFAPLIKRIFDMPIPGLGLLLLLLFLYIIGMIAANIVGRSLIHFGESILDRIPVVKNIYQTTKQILHTVSVSTTLGFKRVVFIEFPRKGLYALGFVTNFIQDAKTERKFTVVFVPHAPNPISGFFELVSEDDIIETNLTIEDGIKMVVSGGLVSPKNLAVNFRETGPAQ